MIQFTHDTTRFTVKPENAQAIRAALAKPYRFKTKVDRQHDAMRRDYPAFVPGMTTAEYVQTFQGLNSRLLLTPHKYIHADREAPTLDPTQPEVFEEADPDYVQPVAQVKRKAPTAAQYRKACADALDLLQQGYTETAKDILREVLA